MAGEYTEAVLEIRNQLRKLEAGTKIDLIIYDIKCGKTWGRIETNFVPRLGDHVRDNDGTIRRVKMIIWNYKNDEVIVRVK